ncbi:Ger(x)C family spore germination protein [Cohnella sp. GCM10027633]|uniref:Ger(x)C family spore germination protein n=1 Tax=unclassified Cohnella TaxID=2636738 RepID=UPI00362791FD
MTGTARINRRLATGALLALLVLAPVGCSPDTMEIGDIALVMAIGVDYDAEAKRFSFSSYSVMPNAPNTEGAGKLTETVAVGEGRSILEAAKTLRSQAGKTLVWMHNKFVIVGEEAARGSLYEILDFLTRNRQVRMSSYFIVSEGKAADRLRAKTTTGDLLSNDLLGKIRNEKSWGRSISRNLYEVADCYPNPHRGFVVGRIASRGQILGGGGNRDRNVLDGGAVIGRGKLRHWMFGQDVLVVQLLSDKRLWANLEFSHIAAIDSRRVTFAVRQTKQSIRSSFRDGKPRISIKLTFDLALSESEIPLSLDDPATIALLERTASADLRKMVSSSVGKFQRELGTDVVGFSGTIERDHSRMWDRIKDEWDTVYPAIQVEVDAQAVFDKQGMIRELKKG